MTKENYTHLILVVDRSGSMDTIAKDMNGGIHTLLKEQMELPGELTVSVCTFDTEIDFDYDFAPADAIRYDLIIPRGSTALNDAIGMTVKREGMALSLLPEDARPDNVILAIVTDGQENASREYNIGQVHAMLDLQKKDYSWQVLFMGTDDIDVVSMAKGYGVPQAQSMSFGRSAKGATDYAVGLSAAVTQSRMGGVADFSSVDPGDNDEQVVADASDPLEASAFPDPTPSGQR